MRQGGKLQSGVSPGYLGIAVALSKDGGTVLAGAYGEVASAGAAYVWQRSSSSSNVWSLAQRLSPATPTSNSYFGYAVAMSDDASLLAIGACCEAGSEGRVYTFARNETGLWTQQQQLLLIGASSGASFGHSVALSGDGSVLAAGAFGDSGGIGASFIFARNSSGFYTQLHSKLVGSGYNQIGGWVYQGYSPALSKDGSRLVVGGWAEDSFAGAVWTFACNSSGLFAQSGAKLLPGDSSIGASRQFGSALSLSADGTCLLVSASSASIGGVASVGATIMFTRIGGMISWIDHNPTLLHPYIASASEEE